MNLNTSNSKQQLTKKDFLTGIKNSNTAILSQAITLIESTNPNHQQLAEEIIENCLPMSGKSIRIGVSGVPGVGKSTFIETFGSELIVRHNKKVAVLAIDPSSKKSHGSILGDKTRMNKLSINNNAFIRPSPSSGTLGGVAKTTRETIVLCEAAGYDVILIETVGVGQSEIEVKSMVDFFLLLMLAGAGDELQGIKKGIMEIADAVIINKADTDNLDNAKRAARDYKNALHLLPSNANQWTPKIDYCSSIENKRIDVVWKIIKDFIELTKNNGSFIQNRKEQTQFWLEHSITHLLHQMFYQDEVVKKHLQQINQDVLEGKISPFIGAKKLLKKFQS